MITLDEAQDHTDDGYKRASMTLEETLIYLVTDVN